VLELVQESVDGGTESVAQYGHLNPKLAGAQQQALATLAKLQDTVGGCWASNSCPPFFVSMSEEIIVRSPLQAEQMQREQSMIDHVEYYDSMYMRAATFFLLTWARLRPPTSN
jgi:hypothetical protein